jgi:hypothetical protein
MKKIIILLVLLVVVGCNKEENTLVPEPIAVNKDPKYTAEVAYIQGMLLGNAIDLQTGKEHCWASGYVEPILRNGIPLPHIVYKANILKPFYITTDRYINVRTISVNIYFEGVDREKQSFELIKKKYVRGAKMSFKQGENLSRDGVSIEYGDWDEIAKTVKGGASNMGSQVGSTWEILDSQEVPVSANAKRNNITNALAITSLVSCKLYDFNGYVGEVKNLKIQVVLNYRKID